ncbi:tetratricopeptide repeat protein [Bacteroidota bacterium]
MNKKLLELTIIFFLPFLVNLYAQSSVENKYRLARNYEQRGDYEKAKTIYEEIVQNQPTNHIYIRRLNSLYLKLKEYEQSINFLESLISNNPDELNFHGLLGSTYYTMGNSEQAYLTWEYALTLKPDNPTSYRIIANFALENRSFKKALEILKIAQSKSDDPRAFSYEIANIYASIMEYDEATKEYCNVLSAQPKQLDYIRKRILTYIDKGNASEETINVIKEYVNNYKSSDVFNELLAFLYTHLKFYERALTLIVSLDQSQVKNGSLIYEFANETYNEKAYEISANGFKFILDNYHDSPFFPSAEIGYARTLEAALNTENRITNVWQKYKNIDTTGSTEYLKMISIYQQLVDKYTGSDINNEAKYRISKIYLENLNELKFAETGFIEIIETAPMSKYSFLAMDKLTELYIQLGDLEKTKLYVSKLINDKRTSQDTKNKAQFKLARIEFWKGNFGNAINLLSVITQNLMNNYANDAIELQLLINSVKSDSLNLFRFAKADYLAEQKKFVEASEEYEFLSENSNSLILKNVSRFNLAEINIVLNNLQKSIEILEELSEQETGNLFADKSIFLLGNIYQFYLLDNKNAVTEYKKLLEKFPNSLYFDISREMLNLININDGNSI